MIKNKEARPDYILTANDRCDSCSAQAYVQVTGVTGELLFCSHHYNKIMDNAVGYDKMMKFMYKVVDERQRLEKQPETELDD
jgi:hypothetical protein